MVEQDPHQVGQLVQSLEAASKKGKGKKTFTCKKSTFAVAGSDNIRVDSWKFMDWDYKRDDLPTYARGLFTTRLKEGRHEICTRGYDKFFNVDEVRNTKWESIESSTRGPYELSVKENGCILFLSGLEDGTLLVCSKHSTGKRDDTPLSHAQAGERWVETHLRKVGKTVQELAIELRRLNATAIGELCDDEFEEHVLAYDEEAAGIYLHGINFNVPEFATLPSSEVHQFADKWGFKKAQFIVMDDIKAVKDFLDKCAETGSWNGRDTEGFVVRCQIREGSSGPYRDWFFKYKFEEPYLMYRQWREVTKAVIAGKLPHIRKHKKITEEYLLYARRQLAKDPKLARLYNSNHGIIAMRDGFLKERGLKGSEIIAMDAKEETSRNVVLVPVASIGCGKTTLAVALVKLFGWGHVQNDNLAKQKNKPRQFALDVTNALALNPAVIADRNNHLKRERQQLIEDVTAVFSDAKYVALQYVHEPKGFLLDDIRRVTRERVLSRGDNHQTIRAGTQDTKTIIGIMEGFVNRFEAIDRDRDPDTHFDEVIDLDVGASSRENLEKVVTRLHALYPGLIERLPSGEELDGAIEAALNEYHVDKDLSWGYKKNEKQDKKNKDKGINTRFHIQDPTILVKNIEYIGITVRGTAIQELLSSIFPKGGPPERAKLYNHLINARRIQPGFHVTLMHRSLNQQHPDVWKQYTDLYIQRMNERDPGDPTTTPNLAEARVRVERLIWNDQIMAFVVRLLPVDAEDGRDAQSWPCVNAVPHITVGTARPEIKPKQSNDMLQQWLEDGTGSDTGLWEAEIPGVKVLEGSIVPVMMRGR
ncbi:tRNA ligase [Talaromyces proteolyticus]|uniref:tRNA ligase n=1 Tax=Talaromyces proteolyticus TaxID=1131652 RepID=A0AAD4KQM2_9EURO|nr:tRNA ligase [Talaromyces proteolyticus]KAH8693264.1 tRNA ligase [Talaromyces proteolyticus]